MPAPAIRAVDLGKRFRLGERPSRYRTLRERLAGAAALRSRAGRSAAGEGTVWALRGVSFTIQPGEVVGLAGANGAGKSTLLKILSRITEPTAGHAEVRGRVGSLLEVGTGFHPELTGRENIFLNGAILGMKRVEIERRFDEIVDFAEVENFLDTPVKRYSSGMHLRLAFAVAAHFQPDILLVDEVLAVGDAAFQSRCLGKMAEVAGEGRTVLLVSHNMSAVRRLARRTLVLEGGALAFDGPVDEGIRRYLQAGAANQTNPRDLALRRRWGSGEGRVERVASFNGAGNETAQLASGEPFSIEIEVAFRRPIGRFVLGVDLKAVDGLPLSSIRSDAQGILYGPLPEGGRLRARLRIPGLPLAPGPYTFDAWGKPNHGEKFDHVYDALRIELQSHGVFAAESRRRQQSGLLLIDGEWSEAARPAQGVRNSEAARTAENRNAQECAEPGASPMAPRSPSPPGKEASRWPEFYILGAPKCGTTALYSFLKSHPEIFLPDVKEPHYFAADLGGYREVRSREDYRALFTEAGGRLAGEASVFYLYSRVAAAHILAERPDAKFLVLLRNPVDLAASLHAHLLWRRQEDCDELAEAWRRQDERLRGRLTPGRCRFPFRLQYGRIARLGEQVERLLETAPRGQVHFVLLEDLAARPGGACRGVLRFLGVGEQYALPRLPRVNGSRARRFASLDRVLAQPPPALRGAKQWIETRAGVRLRPGVRALRNWNDRWNRRPRQPLPKGPFRSQLVEEFRPDVEKLARLIGRDLSHWHA